MLVYSIRDSRSIKFVQMMTLGWPLVFLLQGLCILLHLYGEHIEKSFSQNVLKTNGWNLQCMIRVANPFSYNKNCVLPGLSALVHGLYTCIKLCNLQTSSLKWLDHFFTDFSGAFCWRGIVSLFKGSASWNKTAIIPIYCKEHLKIFFSRIKKALTESWYIALGSKGLPKLLKWWP